MMKKKLNLLILMVVGILAVSMVSAAELEDPEVYDSSHEVEIGVEVNDVLLDQDDSKDVKKSDELDILVMLRFTGTNPNASDLEGVVVEATITSTGHNRDRVSEVSREFDAKLGNIYDERFKLSLPLRMEQAEYSLKIRIDDNQDSKTFLYTMVIVGDAYSLEIKDIILSPEDRIEAGRTLLVSTRIKNRGTKDQEDVKVKVSIPELGISASDYVDEVDKEDCIKDDCDDSVTSGTMYLKIPEQTATGDYQLKVEVLYDDGDEKETKIETIHISGNKEDKPVEDETPKTIITVGPETQEATKGVAVMYPITLTNAGTSARTYTIDVDGADWATVEMSPSNVLVLNAGESKAAYVYVTAKDTAVAGEQMFSITVNSGDKVLKQVPLKAEVIDAPAETTSTWGNLRRALEIGLVVFVVLLVILGLIIGFNKLRGEEEEDKEESQTYY